MFVHSKDGEDELAAIGFEIFDIVVISTSFYYFVFLNKVHTVQLLEEKEKNEVS